MKKLIFDSIPVSVQYSHYDEMERNCHEKYLCFAMNVEGKEFHFQIQHYGDFALIHPEHYDKIPGKEWID